MSALQIVDPTIKRSAQIYQPCRGSGWFWCMRPSGEWAVFYINASWGARDGARYIRTDSFIDVVGPLHPPDVYGEESRA